MISEFFDQHKCLVVNKIGVMLNFNMADCILKCGQGLTLSAQRQMKTG